MFDSYYMSLTGHVSPNKIHDTDVRVVVISPEDREQVDRLSSLVEANGGPIFFARGVNTLQAALREFANPTPPKPDEPQRIGSVVVDKMGHKWVRISDAADDPDGPHHKQLSPPWRKRNRQARWWEHVNAVRILGEGVRDE